MSLVTTILWLGVLGPFVGMLIAHLAGGLTWTRVLLWTAASQLVAVVLYLATQPMPVRVYGDHRPTAGGIVAMKALCALLLIVLGLIIAAGMTPIARWVAGRSGP